MNVSMEKYRLFIKSYWNCIHFIGGTPAILDKEKEKDSVCNCIRYFYALVINHEMICPLLHWQILQAAIMTLSHEDNREIDRHVWQLCWTLNTAFKIRPVFPFRFKMCLKLSIWTSIWFDTCRFIMKNKWTITFPF